MSCTLHMISMLLLFVPPLKMAAMKLMEYWFSAVSKMKMQKTHTHLRMCIHYYDETEIKTLLMAE
jgi:hypothetical protein